MAQIMREKHVSYIRDRRVDTWTEVIVDSICASSSSRAEAGSWLHKVVACLGAGGQSGGQESLVLSAVVRRSSLLLLLGHPPIHRTVGVRHVEAGLSSIENPMKLTRMQVDWPEFLSIFPGRTWCYFQSLDCSDKYQQKLLLGKQWSRGNACLLAQSKAP